VAEKKPEKKFRTRQRTAKRKKTRKQKVGDTASVTLKKPRRVQRGESGYIGFAP